MTEEPEDAAEVTWAVVGRDVMCGVCVALRRQRGLAIQEYDRSREVDLRVLTRRHMREQHGQELPFPW
ncbi:hypothetical protein [Streptomyces sclerotialus]|uniref:hypothetical protein n=1 Tax=Streptomyces sclerotialus TaxID=1957 RepID=UPI0004CA92CA